MMDSKTRAKLRKRIDAMITDIVKARNSLLTGAIIGVPSRNYKGIMKTFKREHLYLLGLRKTMPEDTGKLITRSYRRIMYQIKKDPFLFAID
jgi:hypothetical protein